MRPIDEIKNDVDNAIFLAQDMSEHAVTVPLYIHEVEGIFAHIEALQKINETYSSGIAGLIAFGSNEDYKDSSLVPLLQGLYENGLKGFPEKTIEDIERLIAAQPDPAAGTGEVCPECKGKGKITKYACGPYLWSCPKCSGSGKWKSIAKRK